MNAFEKKELVDSEYNKCKRIMEKAFHDCNYEKAMAAISVASSLLYLWNQRYTDDFLEKSIAEVAERTITPELFDLNCEDTIVFYDSFGLDTRGLAHIYLKALTRINSKVVYITTMKAKGNQPEIDKVIENSHIKKVYFSANKHYQKLKELQELFCTIKPSKAFLYTTPDDSAGIAMFMQLKNTIRYQINLTDHAFWLGVNAFDYCLEFRNYGASISFNERRIPKEKLILLPYYPTSNKDADFQGFPFDIKGKKVVFSGGSLYKTIDKEGTYYYMVSEILKNNHDCLFVYAGTGDDTYLNGLSEVFPNRVFHIPERKDLFQVMKHSTLYLNTYPVCGGLMMQYAAEAGKIPLTLRHGYESDGILIQQKKRKIEYCTAEELIRDVNELLNDDQYLCERESLLAGSVLDSDEFENAVDSIVRTNSTRYRIEVDSIDTKEFRDEYVERFDFNDFYSSISNARNVSLLFEYKDAFVNRVRGDITRIAKKIIARLAFWSHHIIRTRKNYLLR